MNKQLGLLAATLALCCGAVNAQALTERGWAASSELGGTTTSGNTKTSTVKGKLAVEHLLGDWKNKYLAEFLYSRDKEKKTASKWKASAKGNYRFDEISSVFVLSEFDGDEFSDYDLTSVLSSGYTRRLFEQDDSYLDGDIGPGIKVTDWKSDNTETAAVVHLGAVYKMALSEHATFSQELVSDVALNSDNSSVSSSESAITANVMDNLKMKLAYNVKHNNRPGEDKKKVDTVTSITLLYTF